MIKYTGKNCCRLGDGYTGDGWGAIISVGHRDSVSPGCKACQRIDRCTVAPCILVWSSPTNSCDRNATIIGSITKQIGMIEYTGKDSCRLGDGCTGDGWCTIIDIGHCDCVGPGCKACQRINCCTGVPCIFIRCRPSYCCCRYDAIMGTKTEKIRVIEYTGQNNRWLSNNSLSPSSAADRKS